MKINKIALVSSAFILMLGLISCSNGPASNNKPYNTKVFNVQMSEALKASQSFVKSSVKSTSNTSKAAFVELAEEDKWQGIISNSYGYNWNVPSNIYGTSLTAADNTLMINGEDLGTLQDLVHHKENGFFKKAVFEYKGYVYYVLDKGNYVVLSTADDLEHIIFDQEGKINSEDFSNFKIWQWDRYYNGEYYKNGNLGYAYTLRNVTMQDGSKAIVTVSGFNYYNYGLRVWIKEITDNYSGKPAMDPTVYTPQYPAAETMTCCTDESKVDFVYRVENTLPIPIDVYNYVGSKYSDATYNEEAKMREAAKTALVTIGVGESKELKYCIDDLLTAHPYANYIYGSFGSTEYYGAERVYGWSMPVTAASKNKKLTVKVVATENGFDGIRTETYLSGN